MIKYWISLKNRHGIPILTTKDFTHDVRHFTPFSRVRGPMNLKEDFGFRQDIHFELTKNKWTYYLGKPSWLQCWLEQEHKMTGKFFTTNGQATRQKFKKSLLSMKSAKIAKALTNLKFEVMLKPSSRNSIIFLLLEISYQTRDCKKHWVHTFCSNKKRSYKKH